MIARYIALALLCTLYWNLSSQSLVTNQEKYWDYRHRAIEGFMIVGEGQGKSLPSGRKDDRSNYIHWGDATINLAWYMGALATEYYLLDNNATIRTEADNEISKAETLREIYFTLKTINRLDSVAEPFFDKRLTPSINGFFIRDDIPESILKKFPGKKYMNSDFTSEKISDNEESQDQVHHLIMGLMCIYRFVPQGVTYQGMPIALEAKAVALRIIDWMRINKWKVVNPAELDSKGNPTKVKRGPDAYIFSEGTMRIYDEFVRGDQRKSTLKTKLNPFNQLYWSTLRMGANPTYAKADNMHMAMAVIATGNGFKRVTYRKLAKRTVKDDWQVYPLLNFALYPDNRSYRKDEEIMNRTRELLDIAPRGGPIAPTRGVEETGWSLNNRFMRKRDTVYGKSDYKHTAEFPGFDYMLLHNLYLIHQKDLQLKRMN